MCFYIRKRGVYLFNLTRWSFYIKIGYDIYCVNKGKSRIATFEEYDSLVNTDILLDEIKNCREKMKECQFHIIAFQKLLGQSEVLSESYVKENSILESLMEYQEEKVDYSNIHFEKNLEDNIEYTKNSKKLMKRYSIFRKL